jgi:hypothetical protein
MRSFVYHFEFRFDAVVDCGGRPKPKRRWNALLRPFPPLLATLPGMSVCQTVVLACINASDDRRCPSNRSTLPASQFTSCARVQESSVSLSTTNAYLHCRSLMCCRYSLVFPSLGIRFGVTATSFVSPFHKVERLFCCHGEGKRR